MLRRLMLLALALCAFAALESCGMTSAVAPGPGPFIHKPVDPPSDPTTGGQGGQDDQPLDGGHAH